MEYQINVDLRIPREAAKIAQRRKDVKSPPNNRPINQNNISAKQIPSIDNIHRLQPGEPISIDTEKVFNFENSQIPGWVCVYRIPNKRHRNEDDIVFCKNSEVQMGGQIIRNPMVWINREGVGRRSPGFPGSKRKTN